MHVDNDYDVILVKDALIDLGLLESNFLQLINHVLVTHLSGLFLSV